MKKKNMEKEQHLQLEEGLKILKAKYHHIIIYPL